MKMMEVAALQGRGCGMEEEDGNFSFDFLNRYFRENIKPSRKQQDLSLNSVEETARIKKITTIKTVNHMENMSSSYLALITTRGKQSCNILSTSFKHRIVIISSTINMSRHQHPTLTPKVPVGTNHLEFLNSFFYYYSPMTSPEGIP